MRRVPLSALLLLCAVLSSCARRAYDYGAFYAHEPRSILVVPILNETVEVMAPNLLMTAVSTPLAERGYYVFPVHLTDALLKDLGLPDAGLVHQLPAQKFRERFGADAILLITIKDWSSRYILISNTKTLEIDYRLVDARTGTELWHHTQLVQQSSSDGSSSIVGALVSAAVDKLVTEAFESQYRPLARQVNVMAFTRPYVGLPAGPYHPRYGKDRASFPDASKER